MTVTGIDYLTGQRGIPVSDLRFITKDRNTPDSDLFPDVEADFPRFAALFARKYGVANSGQPPVVLTDESLGIVRSHFKATDGQINRVDDYKARKSW
jgi:hypothetical protein